MIFANIENRVTFLGYIGLLYAVKTHGYNMFTIVMIVPIYYYSFDVIKSTIFRSTNAALGVEYWNTYGKIQGIIETHLISFIQRNVMYYFNLIIGKLKLYVLK